MKNQDLKEELPWLINNSLSDDEQNEFIKPLEENADLKLEAKFLSSLRKQIKKNTAHTPGEMGLQKLKRSIKNDDRASRSVKWRYFSIAASLMLVLQAGIMTTLIQQEDNFVPLSGVEYSESVI